MKKRLFIDLDGVCADFDGHYLRTFGKDLRTEKVSDEELWDNVDQYRGDFFYDLPICANTQEALAELRREGYEFVFLTACPASNYEYVARQKHAWVREVLGDTESLVIPIVGGKNKAKVLQQRGDVLVDDFDRNLTAWTAAGGTSILHVGDWSATLDSIYEAFGNA